MNKPLALYIHIPFCLRKCRYCDFCSYVGKTADEMHAYVSALTEEIKTRAEAAQGYTVDTVFFGGGTPTLLPIGEAERIFTEISKNYSMAENIECTVEANPASIDRFELSAWRSLGCNRLSVGVQSLSDAELSLLGRVHTARDARSFLSDARRAGFDDLNVDVMFGIPEQTADSAEETLTGLMEFSPEHISAYSLIVEEGTPFASDPSLRFPDEESEDAIYHRVHACLTGNGYGQYEISNYARPGEECRHNLHYWRCDEYLGFGCAAYSYFGGERFGNGRDLGAYLNDPVRAVVDRETVGQKERAKERIMLGLRLAEGISLSAYKKEFGEDLTEKYKAQIERYQAWGKMRVASDRMALTPDGMRVSNTILAELLPD